MSLLRTVTSAGMSLAVREHSPPAPGRPTVVLVHGYPDQQELWDLVVDALPADRLHVVTYDVRGAGLSDAPETVAGFRTELLVDDFVAVLDAVLPRDGHAHIVGHDWGSIQLWEAVAVEPDDPRLAGRIASFTSISGPALSHVRWLSRHPRGRRLRLLRQLARLWYVYAFLVPGPADLAWRAGHGALARLVAARRGLGRGQGSEQLARNATQGLNLYRANLPRTVARDADWRTSVPVQVIRPTKDAYVTEVLLEDLDRFCDDVRIVDVEAGHWVPRSHPERVAALVLEHVEHTESRTRPAGA